MKHLIIAISILTSLTGCMQHISFSPAPTSDEPGGVRVVDVDEAWRPGTVLFLNKGHATEAVCALFTGSLNWEDILVPSSDGGIGLGLNPIYVFGVHHPRTRANGQKPGATVVAGFSQNARYTAFCINQSMWGMTDMYVRSFRLPNRLLSRRWTYPSIIRNKKENYMVNHIVQLSSRSGDVDLSNLTFAFDPLTVFHLLFGG